MMLPFTQNLEDILKDLIGVSIYLIPESALRELRNLYIVDTIGIAIWSIIFLAIGLFIGRTTKKTKIIYTQKE